MSANSVVQRLLEIAAAPVDEAAFELWLELDDVVPLLRQNAREREIVTYAGLSPHSCTQSSSRQL